MNGNPNGGAGRYALVARVSYKDFLNCQPRSFSGTKGVIGLARWFKKIESGFRISNCPLDSQVKFVAYTLLDGALTWWNSHVQTVGIDEAYEMSWKDLMKLMIEVYCPRNEIQKLEKEDEKIERMASSLMDQKVRTYAARSAENKRKLDSQCIVKCNNYKKVGHMAKDCKDAVVTQAPRAPVPNQRVVTCFGCGGQGHYKSDCPKMKSQNRGNKSGNPEARGRAYAIGGGDANPDSNVVTVSC
ncbi:putative reverse transcriptase domain-containing protein [Tanacetum coccineum]